MADRNKVRPNAATRNGAQISVLLPSFSFSPPNMFLVGKRENAEIEILLGQLDSPSKDIFQMLFEVFCLKFSYWRRKDSLNWFL